MPEGAVEHLIDMGAIAVDFQVTPQRLAAGYRSEESFVPGRVVGIEDHSR